MTDLERGPSSDGEIAICASSLNKSPDPHSVVERLLTRAQSRCDKDRALGDSSIMTPENYLEWQAATIISKLQAEVERDKLYWNGRCVDLQVNAHGWMNAHDQLLGFIQSRPELLKALIDEKFAIKYPSPADVPEILQRALAAESSLSRIQSETVEACAKVAEKHTWTLPLYAPEENINVAVGEAANIVISQVASAIRSLTNGGSGAEDGAAG